MSVPFVRAAKVAAVAPGTAIVVRAGRYEVAIFNAGGALVAFENVCPHQGGPIGEGFIDGTTVTCPWHAWCFDLRTGSLTMGDFARLTRFDVRVDGDTVFVSSEPSQDAA
ncbi:MAG TPA: Rieske (2Fe-2S) protein [Candidatus Cybelea sp.]|nr:Rieske (2Fe-2S) protein [Candidatus Cybelea sp.]